MLVSDDQGSYDPIWRDESTQFGYIGHVWRVFGIAVFDNLQMMRTRSGKLCSCFELQILLLCGSLPLQLPSFFAGIDEYRGW